MDRLLPSLGFDDTFYCVLIAVLIVAMKMRVNVFFRFAIMAISFFAMATPSLGQISSNEADRPSLPPLPKQEMLPATSLEPGPGTGKSEAGSTSRKNAMITSPLGGARQYWRSDSPTNVYAKVPSLPDGGVIASSDDCAPLSVEQGWQVRNHMVGFEIVFGVPTIKWTPEDFYGLIRLARACHNQVVNGHAIDGNNYATMIEAAMNQVGPVNEAARVTQEYANSLAPEAVKLPPCWELLTYEEKKWEMSDNSGDIFGRDFMLLSDEDLQRVVNYTNECLLYAPDYARYSRAVPNIETTNLLNSIMDRALLIIKRRADWTKWNHRPSDLVLTIDGAKIPPTMTSEAAREMILRYDRAAATGHSFTPETVSTLMRMVDEVLTVSANAYDEAYAEEIRRLVHEQIFKRPG